MALFHCINPLVGRHIGKNIQVRDSHEGNHWLKKVKVEVEVRVMACLQFRESLPLGLATRRDVNIVANSM